MHEHSTKFVAFSKTVMSTGGCSKTRASWTLPLVLCNVICKQPQPRKHSHNKINFATKVLAIAVNFRYFSGTVLQAPVLDSCPQYPRGRACRLLQCGDTCSYTRYIVCNSNREKDKAIQALQGKDFAVTNPQIRVITAGPQSSSWPSQWKKETLALNNQLGCAWWKQHMKADFSPTILPRSGLSHTIPKIQSYSSKMELWAPIPCNPHIYWHCILMHPQLHCLDTYGPTPFPHGP
jgi:hypothetical protein